MTATQRILLPTTLVLLSALLISCGGSSGDGAAKSAQPGTPAFFWAAAKQSWQKGDYLRTTDHLAKITQSDNEYRARAEAWLLLVSTGLTQGYMEVADAFDAGAKGNLKNALAFRRQASAARSAAKATSLQAVEALHYFTDKVKDQTLPLDIGAPTGTLADSPVLLRIMKGTMPAEAEVESTRNTMLRKGVLASACRAVGAPDDPAKTVELFRQQPLQLNRATFLLGIASAFNDQMALFGSKQLDDPVRQKLLGTEAAEALKQVPESKESKALDGKLQKALKAIKTSA